jgi:[CysO sulfur-carrier protein]-S-L-cysteine hydrolase
MRIAQSLIDEMVAHAREDLPNECCGLVGGSEDEAKVVIPVANAAASPLRYEMDPQEQYNALKAIEDQGDELLAIYHSHTKSAAYPSQTDVNQAVAWPDQIYLIVSLADLDAPDVKGYLLKDLKIADAEVDIPQAAE